LHLALKSPQCIFQRFTLLDDYFSHVLFHPQSGSDWFLCGASTTVGTAPGTNYRTYCAFRRYSGKVAGLF
jgi:hypothetical protein